MNIFGHHTVGIPVFSLGVVCGWLAHFMASGVTNWLHEKNQRPVLTQRLTNLTENATPEAKHS